MKIGARCMFKIPLSPLHASSNCCACSVLLAGCMMRKKSPDDSFCHYHACFCLELVPFTVEVDSNEDNLALTEPKFTSVGDLLLI